MRADHPRVLGVLAGADMALETLAAWAKSADVVYAADGGGDRLLTAGVPPDTTIGDLDSIESVLPFRRLIQDPDQATSDCDKMLALAERSGHDRITLIGIEGDRLDHVLSSLSSAAKSPLEIRVVLRHGIAHLLRGPTQQSFASTPAETISLIPLTSCSGISLAGVEWPLQDVEMAPAGFLSLSNRSLDNTVSVSLQTGIAVLFCYSDSRATPTW